MIELVLIPGLNNTHAVFDGVAAHLPPTIRVQAVNCPPLNTVEAIAAALLPQLPERFWLGGFSFGGYVALALLELAPARVEGLAMICTSPYADTAAQVEKRRAALCRVREGEYLEMIEAQAANAFHPASLANEALMTARRHMVEAYGPGSYVAHVEAVMQRPDRTHLLDGRIPTAVITASHDTVVPEVAVLKYAREIPHAEVSVIRDAGHLAPMEQPRQVAQVLANWMGQA